jgi:hypothetical protein
MEYITKHCPKCQGELHIPSELKSCICMYCGEALTFHEESNNDIPPAALDQLEEGHRNALQEIPQLIQGYELLLSKFSRDKYADAFEEYAERTALVLDSMERYALVSKEKIEFVVKEAAAEIVGLIEKELQGTKAGLMKAEKTRIMDEYRFFLTVYMVPMVRYRKLSISEALADAIIEEWVKKYPKFSFQKSSFENLNEGFRRKGFCFITSAVCDTLNKADDCYELTAFRQFRDNYMQQTPERRSYVKEYYSIAPVIVTSINLRASASEIYQGLWENYLKSCLRDIENNNFASCEETYKQMVIELKEKYDVISRLAIA